MTLQGKRVLITGGARRMGRAIALACAREGADVAITFNESAAKVDGTMRELAEFDIDAYAIRCDVTDPLSVREAVAEALDQLGGLDLLVNNAGRFESAALETMTVEQWDRMFTTNARGPWLVAQAAYEALRTAQGRIVNIGSLGGIEPWKSHGHYNASKAALHMLTRVMAKSWAPEISVNCVAPGSIALSEPGVELETPGIVDKTPMRRFGTGDDIADAVLFFATGPKFVT
jgi:NAD(P)-dependent dehydrogenase (short-subunit alcohol dehydrogenase family)